MPSSKHKRCKFSNAIYCYIFIVELILRDLPVLTQPTTIHTAVVFVKLSLTGKNGKAQ